MQERLLECECVVMQQTVYRDVLADAQVWKQACFLFLPRAAGARWTHGHVAKRTHLGTLIWTFYSCRCWMGALGRTPQGSP